MASQVTDVPQQHSEVVSELLAILGGYLENPLDPLNPLAPRPTTLDPRLD